MTPVSVNIDADGLWRAARSWPRKGSAVFWTGGGHRPEPCGRRPCYGLDRALDGSCGSLTCDASAADFVSVSHRAAKAAIKRHLDVAVQPASLVCRVSFGAESGSDPLQEAPGLLGES